MSPFGSNKKEEKKEEVRSPRRMRHFIVRESQEFPSRRAVEKFLTNNEIEPGYQVIKGRLLEPKTIPAIQLV